MMHIHTHTLHTALNAGTLLTDLMLHKELVCMISLSVCHGAFLSCSDMPGSAGSQAGLLLFNCVHPKVQCRKFYVPVLLLAYW